MTLELVRLGCLTHYAPDVERGWLPDELEYAGAEHRDPLYAAGYDAKTGFAVGPDLELLQRLGVGTTSTLVDLGAGTGLLAAAAAPYCARIIAVDPSPAMLEVARARGATIECVEAGFLTYEHVGEAADAVYSRNALHHLPDVWKAVALDRIADLLRPGGAFILRDILFSCDPDELGDVLEAWFGAAATDPREGWTRAELEAHVRESTARSRGFSS